MGGPEARAGRTPVPSGEPVRDGNLAGRQALRTGVEQHVDVERLAEARVGVDPAAVVVAPVGRGISDTLRPYRAA